MDLSERVAKLEASLARSRMQLGIAVLVLVPLTLAALVAQALLLVGWPRRLAVKVDRLEAREIEVSTPGVEKSGRVALHGNEYGGRVVLSGPSTPNMTLRAMDTYAGCTIQGFGHQVMNLYADERRGALEYHETLVLDFPRDLPPK
jgi:hypothetical protein